MRAKALQFVFGSMQVNACNSHNAALSCTYTKCKTQTVTSFKGYTTHIVLYVFYVFRHLANFCCKVGYFLSDDQLGLQEKTKLNSNFANKI